MIKNLTDEEFIVIVKNSNNIGEICRKLGVVLQPGNYNLIKQEIARLNLDTTHFERKTKLKREKHKRWEDKDVFVKDSKYKSQQALKVRILKQNLIPYVCSICGQQPQWQNKKLVLVLDHINGDHFDCRLQNLRFVCPNCNSQLETTCGKNVKDRYICKECGKKITRQSKSKLCPNCRWKVKRKEKSPTETKGDIPTKEILEEKLQTKSYSQIGRQYGMSSSAVRNWCKKYGITLSKEQIKKRQKEILLKNKNKK